MISKDEEKPWWFPILADASFCERLRKDYPENASMSDEELIDYYADGKKYAITWDHIGDAYEEYENLADAYLATDQQEAILELRKALIFFDKVNAESADKRISVGHDHWDWLESAARRVAKGESDDK